MQTVSVVDLTTTKAPFIEDARGRGDVFIEQPYDLYSAENHESWSRLYAGMLPAWERYANERFLEGLERIDMPADRVPRLDDITHSLSALSGFSTKAVSGYVPAFTFFDCLRRREFPTTITIRSLDSSAYLPEPDIFHDLAGHVPMHTGRMFSDALVHLGGVATQAALLARDEWPADRRDAWLRSAIRAIARFFWFTVEFGLLRQKGELKVYGSGLLSSRGEIVNAVEDENVQRHPFQLEWVINQGFEIDRYQPLLFVVDSFEHLFNEVGRLERWLLEGRLVNVAEGNPEVSNADFESFLEPEIGQPSV